MACTRVFPSTGNTRTHTHTHEFAAADSDHPMASGVGTAGPAGAPAAGPVARFPPINTTFKHVPEPGEDPVVDTAVAQARQRIRDGGWVVNGSPPPYVGSDPDFSEVGGWCCVRPVAGLRSVPPGNHRDTVPRVAHGDPAPRGAVPGSSPPVHGSPAQMFNFCDVGPGASCSLHTTPAPAPFRVLPSCTRMPLDMP
jgi:hypothetical protein